MRISRVFFLLLLVLMFVLAHVSPSHLLASQSQSHATHFVSSKGPQLPENESGCYVCHAEGIEQCQLQPLFADDEFLATTNVCDLCHSPAGAFDGVAMAKAGWRASVYDSDGKTLKAGKEQWCAPCHDDDPAFSQSQPNLTQELCGFS